MNKFLLFTRTPWDEPPRARHQVAEALSSKGIVYFIEANKFGFPKIEIKKESENLYLITPFFPISYKVRFRLMVFNELFQYWLIKALKIKIKNITSSVLVNFDHTAYVIIKRLNLFSIYYCNDDHIRTHNIPVPFLTNYFNYCEKQVAQYSNFTVGTSIPLQKKLLKYNKCSYLIKLGAPSLGFSPMFHQHSNNKIRVALIGFISTNRIPINVLFEILEDEKMELNVFGSISDFLYDKLKHFKNFVYHGIKTGNDLYRIVNTMDIGIAPYNIEDVNIGGTPNKLWIYLALGKPVVVTELNAIKNWTFREKFVYKSKNNLNFKYLIQLAYSEDNKTLFELRVKYAEENSWRNRINELIKYIQQNKTDATTNPTA